MLSEGIKRPHTTVLATACLRNKEPVVWQGILVCPTLKTTIVDVGSQHRQLWSPCLPKVYQMSKWTSRGILSGLAPPAVHGCIHVKRYLGMSPSRLAESAHIFSIMVRHEYLVRIDIIAENVFPCLCAKRLDARFQPRVKRILILFQVGNQFLWNSLPINLFCQWRVVACRLQHTYLILYLQHRYHILSSRSDVFHQRLKGTIVGTEHFFCEATGNLQWFAVLRAGSWKTLRVFLKPQRRIA